MMGNFNDLIHETVYSNLSDLACMRLCFQRDYLRDFLIRTLAPICLRRDVLQPASLRIFTT